MTKWGGFPFRAGGHDVADFHLAVGDDDAIDEEFDQLSALSKGQSVQGRVDTVAESLDPPGQGRHIHLLLGLRLELAPLLGQAMLGLGHLLSFAFELIAADDFSQIDLQQARLLTFQLCEGLLDRAAPRLQGVWEPLTSLGPLQFMGHQGRFGQDPTEVLPHHVVEGPGWSIASGAAFPLGGPQCIGPAATDIIVVARVQGAARTGQLTLSTTDQPAQQVVMGRIVAPGELGIAIQPRLCSLKGLLADDRRHRNGDPFLRGAG